jgi:hypothetical protein
VDPLVFLRARGLWLPCRGTGHGWVVLHQRSFPRGLVFPGLENQTQRF